MLRSPSLLWLLSLLAVLLPPLGCVRPPSPPTTVPMREIRAEGPAGTTGEQARCLFVFLPGYGASPEDFVERGFIDQLEANVDADATVVDAHIGYYLEESILDRLEEDVIGPAKAAGYEKVWFVAASMGALGALGYGATHAAQVDGVVLLAPWMGFGFGFGLIGVQGEIADRGGLVRWRDAFEDESGLDGAAPLGAYATQESFSRLVWAWAARPLRPDGSEVPIYVGYGQQDRWVESQALLADAYPARRKLLAGGLHHWDVFYDVWRGFLWQGFMQRSCGRAQTTPLGTDQ